MFTNSKAAANGKDAEGRPTQIVIARPATSNSQEDVAPDLGTVVHAVRRRWKWALPLGMLLANVGGAVGWLLFPPRYSASAYLQVDAQDQRLIFETADTPASNYMLYKNTQKQLLVTPFVLNAALRNPEVANAKPFGTDDPITWLKEGLRVSYPGDGEVMEVTLETPNGKDCVVLVNAVVDAFLTEVVLNERNDRLQRVNSLETARTEAETKVRNKRAELKQLADALGTSDSESLTVAQQSALQQFGLMQEKLSAIQFELMQAEGELQLAEVQQKRYLTAAQQVMADNGTVQTDEAALLAASPKPPELIRLEDELDMMRTRLASMSRNAGSNHPTVQRYSEELQAKEAQFQRHKSEFERGVLANLASDASSTRLRPGVSASLVTDLRSAETQVATLQSEVAILKRQEEILKEKVNQLSAETRQLGKSSIDVELMRSEIDGLEGVLARVGEELERTNIELRTSSRVRLLSAAETASPPSSKKRIAAAGALGLGSLLFPFVAFVAFDMRRKSVNDVESTANALDLPTIGTIPMVARDPFMKGSTTRGRHLRQSIELMEAVDAAAAMLLHRARIEKRSVIMISSAVANEGKTTVSCLLAESLAKCGKRVALVDFDLRRPSVSRYLDIPNTPGIAEVLSRQVAFPKALYETAISNLWVLPAGNSHNVHFDEAAIDGSFDRLFENLRLTFDLVIVDSSPILPIVDSRVLGRFTDGVIMTLIRDASRIPAASKACEVLKSHGVEVLGTIIIGARSSTYPGYYYYGKEGEQRSTRPRLVRKSSSSNGNAH